MPETQLGTQVGFIHKPLNDIFGGLQANPLASLVTQHQRSAHLTVHFSHSLLGIITIAEVHKAKAS
jgi:hypothetical protein